MVPFIYSRPVRAVAYVALGLIVLGDGWPIADFGILGTTLTALGLGVLLAWTTLEVLNINPDPCAGREEIWDLYCALQLIGALLCFVVTVIVGIVLAILWKLGIGISPITEFFLMTQQHAVSWYALLILLCGVCLIVHFFRTDKLFSRT